MVHLIMASEPCEKAGLAPFIFLAVAYVNDIEPRALQLSMDCKRCVVDTRPESPWPGKNPALGERGSGRALGLCSTLHLDGMTRAHAYPSVLLKDARNNDTTTERPPGQSLATRRGSGAVPALRPSERSKLKTRGLLARPAVARKTPHSLD
jgi:hypothetical protein